jgi:hypothetical protein
MADYTFSSFFEPLKNNNTIQTVLDIDVLAGAAKTALAGYVTSLKLPTEQTQHLLWENVGIAVIIESLAITYYLPSLGTQTPAPNLKRTSTLKDRVIEMQGLESRFPKCQMLFFARSSAVSNWVWLNTEVIQNSGNRVNTLKLLPYLNQREIFIPGRGTQIGIQFIADPISNSTLPQAGDRLTVQGSIGLDINPIGTDSKKNDEVEQLKTRLAALETLIQPFGAATATAAGTTGLVSGAATGESEFLLRGDRAWQNPAAFVQMIGEQLVGGLKSFADILTGSKTIRSIGAGDLSTFSAQSQAALFSVGAGGYISVSSSAAPVNTKVVDFGMNAQGECLLRRINDTYTSVVSTLATFDPSHNLKFSNFTNFGGNIFLKVFLINGITASSQGTVTSFALGIDSTKVVGFFPLVHYGTSGRMPPGFELVPGYEYESFIANNALVFRLHPTNAVNILSLPCSCLVFYTN